MVDRGRLPFFALVVVTVAGAVPIADAAPAVDAGASVTCVRPVQVLTWSASEWQLLAEAFARRSDPCARYYVSIPAVRCAGRKTCPRGPIAPAEIHALGARFHAAAEFHWTSWKRLIEQNGLTWYQAGVEFRRRMTEKGYDVERGDLWVINELPSSVRTGAGGDRAHARELVRGLYDGPSGSPKVKGAVLVWGMGHRTVNVGPYLEQSKGWLLDESFWSAMAARVRLWAQEVYTNPKQSCVPGALLGLRSRRTNEYTEHPARLADAGPPGSAVAREFFDVAYVPLLNAAWRHPPNVGYGDTSVPLATMKAHVSAQIYAARAWSNEHSVPDARIGFAWHPRRPAGVDPAAFRESLERLAERMAAGVAAAYRHGAGGASYACGPTGDHAGCACSVEGAAFNPSWEAFAADW